MIEKYEELHHRLWLTCTYNQKRSEAYTNLTNWMTGVVAFFSFAAAFLASVEGGKWVAATLSLFSAAISLFSVTLGWASKATLCERVSTASSTLLGQVEKLKDSEDLERFEAIENQMDAADNLPLRLSVLEMICRNEYIAYIESPQPPTPIGFWQRRFAPFFDVKAHELQVQPVPRGQ